MATGVYAMRWGLTAAADIPLEFDGAKFQLKAGEPNAKHGGVVRMGIPIRPPHFDLHQSGTIFNLGAMGCMFDNLIRHDPRDGGKTIIPDLAHSWQIAKDGKTYTFLLRDDVQFHDSTQLTADDVKATFDRIAKPPQGISIPRSILFKAVSEINARDKYTVEFKLSEPRPVNFMMSAIASGWNVIVRKKTLEDNRYDLRKVQIYPGTGPFRSVKYTENEVWTMEKNKNYWNKELPYLDGIEFYHCCRFLQKWHRQYWQTVSITFLQQIPLRSERQPRRRECRPRHTPRASFTQPGSATGENRSTIRGSGARCTWSSTGRC